MKISRKTQIETLCRLLLVNARLVYTSCLVGNPCQHVAERLKRITTPRCGDLVMEISSQYESNPLDHVGRLIMVADEPIHHEEWNEEPKPLVDYWYIETLDGRLMIWHNCAFIVVSEFEDFLLRSSRRDEYDDPNKREAWVKAAKIRHELDEPENPIDPSTRGGW